MLFGGSVEYLMNDRNHKGNIYTCNNEAKSVGADDGTAAIYSPFNSLKHFTSVSCTLWCWGTIIFSYFFESNMISFVIRDYLFKDEMRVLSVID